MAIFEIQTLPKLIPHKIEWQTTSCIMDLDFTFWNYLEHSAKQTKNCFHEKLSSVLLTDIVFIFHWIDNFFRAFIHLIIDPAISTTTTKDNNSFSLSRHALEPKGQVLFFCLSKLIELLVRSFKLEHYLSVKIIQK